MAHRRNARGRIGQRSDRQPVWFFIRVSTTAVAGGSTAVLLSTFNAAALLLRPFTIIRTHLLLQMSTDQSIASELFVGAYGMQVVTEQAAAAGIASVPTPISETDADFFVYQPVIDSFLFADATGIVEPSGIQYSIDSKAMRKVGINEDLSTTIESTSGSDGGLITVIGRMLVKLH